MSIELPEIAGYLTGVSSALADLDAEERDDLLADVHAHLVDVAREGGSLVARLGPPDAYAAELRAAAGLPAPEATARPSLGTRLERAVARLAANGLAVRALETARTLAPVWWVARGYVAAVVLSRVADGDGWSTTHPWVPHLHGSGSHPLAGPAIRVPEILTPSLVPTIGLRTHAFRPTPRPPAPDPAPTG